MNGTWKTTGGRGVTISAGGVLALAGAALVLSHPKQAESAVSGAAIAIAVTAGAVVLAVVTVIVLRVRGHRRAALAGPQQQAVFWKANPRAIPVQPRREIAAPAVTVNIDAGLLAGLMNAMQPQPVRVIPEQSEQQEIPR
jgi:hypothetical protein